MELDPGERAGARMTMGARREVRESGEVLGHGHDQWRCVIPFAESTEGEEDPFRTGSRMDVEVMWRLMMQMRMLTR